MQDDLKDLEESYLLAEKLAEKYKDHPETFFFQPKAKKSKLDWLDSIAFAIIILSMLVWHRLEDHLWVSKTKL